MKRALPWFLLVVFAALVWRREGKTAGVIAEAEALLATKDSALAVQKELTDSANARLARADGRRDVVTRLVLRTDTLRLAAETLADDGQWEQAYHALRQAFDSQAVALVQSQREADDVRAAFAFAELRRVGDSTRITNLEHALAAVVRVAKPRWRDRFGLNVGVDYRVKPTAVASYRVWP